MNIYFDENFPPSKKGYTYWEIVEKIIASWREIKNVASREEKPFAYIIKPRSKRLEDL